MRIAGGDARGITLKVPTGVRPASEKVRQAIFSSIASRLPDARVLDLFAGSGAYGIEAVSRGAREATLVDRSRDCVAVCRANAAAAGMERVVSVKTADVERFLQREDGPFDLVFVDPPYGQALHRVLERLGNLLDPEGLVVLEIRWRDEPPPQARGLVVEADRRYGDTRVVVFTRGATG